MLVNKYFQKYDRSIFFYNSFKPPNKKTQFMALI